MAELERDLRELAAQIEWPPTPELALRVEARRRRRSPLLAVALAVIVLAVAVAAVVPGARSAILRFFHLGGVKIEQVRTLPTLPPVPQRPLTADLGHLIDERTAAANLGGAVHLPTLGRRPQFYFAEGVVSVVLTTPEPVLLSEFRTGRPDTFLLKKVVGGSSGISSVRVGRAQGIWIEGEPHLLIMPSAPPRLAGHVLLWQRGNITYRLEGRELTQQAALRLAGQIDGT